MMVEGEKEMAELVDFGVIARYKAGLQMLMMKTEELPAEILVFPVTFIPKSLLVSSGQIWLLDRL